MIQVPKNFDLQLSTVNGGDIVVENIEGAETTVVEIPECEQGTEVALWTLVGAPHIPFPWVPSGLDRFVDWVLEHPRK